MGEASKTDLTQGGILAKLLHVAVPIMGTQLVQMAYNLTDMFWLGRVGSNAVAASGSAGMFMWLGMAFLILGRMGAEIGVSQSMGRREPDSAKAFSQNAMLIGAAFGVLYGLALLLFNQQMISFFDIPEAQVAADAAGYLCIIGLGVPATYISGALTGTFNGAGNSRVSFAANAVGLGVNMLLDPLMIFVFKMDIFGAAWATVIAQWVVAGIFMLAIKWAKSRPFARYRIWLRPDFACIWRVVRWSLPVALESLLFTLLSMLIARSVASYGANAISVSRVGSQVESLSWLIGGGFGSALTAFVGQNYGAGKWSRIHRGFKLSIGAMAIYGVVVTAVLFFLGRMLFYLFLPDMVIADMGGVYLKILAACQLVACLEAVSAGAFRGVGKTLPPSLASILSNAMRVPLSWALSQTSLGLDGIWWGITIGATVRGLWIFVWYVWTSRRLPRADTEALVGATG